MSHSMNPVQVVAVTGGKGGVGKTNVSVNLGVALCKLGRRVTLLDADLGLANVDVLLGLKPRRNLADVLEGHATLAEVVVPGPSGLRIVPAASGTQAMVQLGPREHAGLISAFSEIAHQMDVLIVDTAAGISDEVISFLLAAQEIIVVVCNEPTSITDAYALIKVLNSQYGVKRMRVLANMVRSQQEGKSVFAKLVTVTERFLEVTLEYAGWIPFDEHVRRSVQRQRAVVDAYPSSKASQSFMDLAREVDRWPVPAAPRGHLEFFVERLVATAAGAA
jgi:flagellar biosynthesis protein FlhG